MGLSKPPRCFHSPAQVSPSVPQSTASCHLYPILSFAFSCIFPRLWHHQLLLHLTALPNESLDKNVLIAQHVWVFKTTKLKQWLTASSSLSPLSHEGKSQPGTLQPPSYQETCCSPEQTGRLLQTHLLAKGVPQEHQGTWHTWHLLLV